MFVFVHTYVCVCVCVRNRVGSGGWEGQRQIPNPTSATCVLSGPALVIPACPPSALLACGGGEKRKKTQNVHLV